MAKKLSGFVLLAAVALLILYSEACRLAVLAALSLWWQSVVPALLPFLVCVSLMQRAGLFDAMARRLGRLSRRLGVSPNVLPCFLFGAIAGYPGGARLCAMRGEPDLAPYCNLCSPMFLLGVVAESMLRCRALFLPLCIAHYGSALLLLLLYLLRARGRGSAPVPRPSAPAATGGMAEIVSDSVRILGAVGGSMALFFAAAALLDALRLPALLAAPLERFGVSGDLVSALLHGVLELTGGCGAVTALGLSTRAAAACCAFLVSFGGFCVFLQAKLFLTAGDGRYLLVKLIQGLLAALIAYWIAPRFLHAAVPALSVTMEPYAKNAWTTLGLFLASAIPLFFLYLLGLVLRRMEKSAALAAGAGRIQSGRAIRRGTVRPF